jgi:ABC-type polar amino acid transport system ATPase subunit
MTDVEAAFPSTALRTGRRPVLDVNGLDVRRGGSIVVQGVSFRAERGEILALTGASGSGKTTVLRAIAGLDRIAAGTITVAVPESETRAASGERRGTRGVSVGMVLQFHHLFAHLSALHNVWLAPVHVHRQSKNEAAARARKLLERLGVAHRADAMPHELSGGEAQRVAIARALAMDPPVLLMDEPTASLDAARRADLAATLRDLAAEGRTLVVATHDRPFIEACAHRVLVMDDGRLQ